MTHRGELSLSIIIWRIGGWGPMFLMPRGPIHKMIRKKNRIHRKAKHFNNLMDWNKSRKIRNEVTE
jgi:hypothetical protein